MIGDILQPTHLFFVLVVALLVLGPKRLPEVGRALGSGLRDFKSAISGDHEDHHHEIESSYSDGGEDDLEAQPEPAAATAGPSQVAPPHAAPIVVTSPAQPSEPTVVVPPGARTDAVEPAQPTPDRLG